MEAQVTLFTSYNVTSYVCEWEDNFGHSKINEDQNNIYKKTTYGLISNIE